jgi:hypothetical protein
MTEPLTAAEDELRRFHWYQLAVELGQKEDFLALIAAERRDAVEEYKRQLDAQEYYTAVEEAELRETYGD